VSTLAQHLAEFACSARYDDFPYDVADLAKKCLFDTMGAIIAGSFHSTTGRIAREIAAEHREEETATVAGPLMKRSASTWKIVEANLSLMSSPVLKTMSPRPSNV